MNVHSDAANADADALTDVRVLSSATEVVDAASAFAERIRPGAAERDAKRLRPVAEIRDLRATGLLGMTVPRMLGGPDVSVRTLVEVFRIIAAADPSIGRFRRAISLIWTRYVCSAAILRKRSSSATF